MTARIQIPEDVKHGELFEIRVLIQHPMETGYRWADNGKPIPRNVITRFTCRYNGDEVFSADMSQGIAANPYFQFSLVAVDSGELLLDWVDDEGVRGTERQALTVSQ